MQIKEERIDDVLVLTIDEHLDTATAGAFESKLLGLIDGGEKQILIDCGPLVYCEPRGAESGETARTDRRPAGALRARAGGAHDLRDDRLHAHHEDRRIARGWVARFARSEDADLSGGERMHG